MLFLRSRDACHRRLYLSLFLADPAENCRERLFLRRAAASIFRGKDPGQRNQCREATTRIRSVPFSGVRPADSPLQRWSSTSPEKRNPCKDRRGRQDPSEFTTLLTDQRRKNRRKTKGERFVEEALEAATFSTHRFQEIFRGGEDIYRRRRVTIKNLKRSLRGEPERSCHHLSSEPVQVTTCYRRRSLLHRRPTRGVTAIPYHHRSCA